MIYIKDRSIFKATGNDVIPFLQRLLTNDVTVVEKGQACYALLLTPQGKYLYDFFLFPDADSLFLSIPKDSQAQILKTLNMYALRDDVSIEESDLKHFVSLTPLDNNLTFSDPRNSELGFIHIGNDPVETTDTSNYETKRITLKIPTHGKELISNQSFPLDYDLDTLNAISFTKGCYVGQEVTARVKHRGTPRKALFVIESEQALVVGPVTNDNGKTVGTITSTSNAISLALLDKKLVESDQSLSANEQSLTIRLS